MPPFHYLAVGLALLLGACSTTVETHGHRLDEDRVAQIRPGASSRGDVASLLGTPSALASFDDRTWYYVGRRIEEENFFDRDLEAQDVVRVRFDQFGIVEEVDRFEIADARAVDPVDDETPTGGNELSLVQQFIGNIGRFNPAESGTPGSSLP
jgi:outer membrane protein assembly factor BamE (lipoprotein component of BamABCDE complex)